MPQLKRMQVAFLGGQNAGLIAALTLLAHGVTIRRAVIYSTDIKESFSLFKIPVSPSVLDETFVNELKDCDLLISVHGREIVPDKLLNRTRTGSINLHPYLYKYKGADPVGRALRDGETRASVGAHRMTRNVDQGEVLVEEFIDTGEARTVEEIYNLLYPLYVKVLVKTLEKTAHEHSFIP